MTDLPPSLKESSENSIGVRTRCYTHDLLYTQRTSGQAAAIKGQIHNRGAHAFKQEYRKAVQSMANASRNYISIVHAQYTPSLMIKPNSPLTLKPKRKFSPDKPKKKI